MLDRLIFRADRMALLGVRLGGAMILFAALMVSADVLTRRLFGVTMVEQGVSQLVSVDLKRAEALVA